MTGRTQMLLVVSWLVLTAAPLGLHADEPNNIDGLEKFTSREGGFTALLPGEPAYDTTTVGKAQEVQHQFAVGRDAGVYLISYQENPNLEGSPHERLVEALESGRDRLLEAFGGKLLENKATTLDKKHPGLEFRYTIPAAKGEARCRFYMVGTRLYQIMALGTPEFAGSDEATRVLNSFALVE